MVGIGVREYRVVEIGYLIAVLVGYVLVYVAEQRVLGVLFAAVDNHFLAVGKLDNARVALPHVHEMHVEVAGNALFPDVAGSGSLVLRLFDFLQPQREVNLIFKQQTHAEQYAHHEHYRYSYAPMRLVCALLAAASSARAFGRGRARLAVFLFSHNSPPKS